MKACRIKKIRIRSVGDRKLTADLYIKPCSRHGGRMEIIMENMNIELIFVTVPLIVLALFALIGGIKGFKQGTPRQVIHIVMLAASAIIAVFIAKAFYGKVSTYFDGMTIQQIHDWLIALPIIPEGFSLDWLMSFDIATIKSILIIPMTLIVIPALFVIFFLILSVVMKIVHFIFCGIFGLSRRNKTFISSVFGFVIGAVEALLIVVIILIPAFGLVNAAKESVAKVNEEMPEETGAAELTAAYNTYLAPIADNPIVSMIGSFGPNQIFEALVTFDEGGVTMNTADLLPDAAMIYASKGRFEGFHWQTVTPDNKYGITRITDIIENNPFFTKFCADAIRSMATAYCDGKIPLPLTPPYDEVVDETIHIFMTTDETNVHQDADTILAVYYILAESGALVSYTEGSDAMLESLTAVDGSGSTPVNRIIDEIKRNERLKPLITLITKLSISVMTENLGLSPETQQTYENVKAGLNETLKIDRESFAEGEAGEAEYKAAVSDSIDETLKENGITLEPDIVDEMANYVAENMSEVDEITDEELNDVILSYYDAYIEYKNSGTLPPLP